MEKNKRYIVLTPTGLYWLPLDELKFHTTVRGWTCTAGNHVYNYIFDGDIYLADTICRGFNDIKVNLAQPTEFKPSYGICAKNNCSCGYDIAIPKGRTKADVERLISKFVALSDADRHALPRYSDNSEIQALGLAAFLLRSLVHVDWFLGKRCNFDCFYCSPSIHDSVSKMPSLSEMIERYHYLISSIELSNRQSPLPVQFLFHGGEPTLIPDYIEFLNYIRTHQGPNTNIRTLTNLSRQPDYLLKLNSVSDLVYSVHLAYLTDAFMDKACRFFAARTSNSRSLSVKVMYQSQYQDRIEQLINAIEPFNNLHFSIVPLHNKADKNLYPYSEDDRRFFKIKKSPVSNV